MSNEYEIPLLGKMVCWVVGGVVGGLLIHATTQTIVLAQIAIFAVGLYSHFKDRERPGVTDEEIKADDLNLLARARLLRNRPGKITEIHAPRMRKSKKPSYRVEPFDTKKHK
jgi:hypothetical protein